MRGLILLLAVCLIHAPRAFAQSDAGGNGYRFQPPRPPPLDGADFDDGDEDMMEMGDDYRNPPPPPPGGNNGGPPPMPGTPPPPPDFRPSNNFSVQNVAPGKFRFQVVEGEYWEKGKKRSRGRETRVSGGKSE